MDFTVKFSKETRFLLGVAVVKKDNNDGEHGTQLEPLDYTEQNVITLKDCNERIANKIIQVKHLSRESKAWIMDPQEDGKLYLDDPVSRIAGIGKGIEKSLKDNYIMTVADLRGLNQQTMKSIAKTTRGLGLSLLE